ncbi:MAG: hypothetical protein HZB76_00735 [Chlamydiae bacterium]|nr:hypothetical protein [Chlamydiota bacterium]
MPKTRPTPAPCLSADLLKMFENRRIVATGGAISPTTDTASKVAVAAPAARSSAPQQDRAPLSTTNRRVAVVGLAAAESPSEPQDRTAKVYKCTLGGTYSKEEVARRKALIRLSEQP